MTHAETRDLDTDMDGAGADAASEQNWLDLPSVVVAVTAGAESDAAIQAAHQWARAQRTRLIVYHSVVGHAPLTGQKRVQERRRHVEELTARVLELTRRRPRQVKVVVDSAPVVVGILRAAQMNNAGIILLGPGEGSSDGISARVLRRTTVPVMLARNGASVRRMVVVADLEGNSRDLAQSARQFAMPLRARLTVLHASPEDRPTANATPRLAEIARANGAEPVLARGCPLAALETVVKGNDASVVMVDASTWPLEGSSAPRGRRLIAAARTTNIVYAPGRALSA